MRIRALSRRQFLSMAAVGAVVACSGEDEVPVGPSTSSTGGGGAGGASSSSSGVGAGGAGGSGPTGPGPEPADPWQPSGTVDGVAFAWGVQTGDALPDAVLVSMHTLEPTVSLSVAKGVEAGWEVITSMMAVTVDQGMVHLELGDLDPDTTYAITFYAEDVSRRSRVARFRTALAPTQTRTLRFGVSSCLGYGDYGSPCLSHSLAEKLDFFLLGGDQIYADELPDVGQFVKKYETALPLPGLNDVTAGTSIVVTWDDHEIYDNWSWADMGIQQEYDDSLAAFRQFMPQRMGPTNKIWRKLSWGSAMDVFVLDCRSERLNGNYISVEQMDWLKQELSASTATFKVILNSVPIFDFTGTGLGSVGAEDRWQGFPAQRTEILEHIRNGPIGGVLWLTGDVHFGALGKVDPTGGPGDFLWEVIAGPGGSDINPASLFFVETQRMPLVVTTFNWVLLEADPSMGTVDVSFIDRDGNVLKSQQIKVA